MSTDMEHIPGAPEPAEKVLAPGSSDATPLSAAWLRENHRDVVQTLAIRYCGGPRSKPNRQQRREAMARARQTWRHLLRDAVRAERGGGRA